MGADPGASGYVVSSEGRVRSHRPWRGTTERILNPATNQPTGRRAELLAEGYDMKAPTLSIGARDLYALFDAASPFASSDSYTPLLNSVRLEVRGPHLVAMATDRYRAVMQRLAGDWPEGFAMTVPLGTIRALRQMFKPLRGLDVDLSLTPNEDGTRLDVTAEGALLDLLAATAAYTLEPGDYPKFASMLLQGFDLEPDATPFQVNPRLLADFGKIKADRLLVKASGPSKPLIITDGEDFIGALMPSRRADGGDLGIGDDSWRGLLTFEAKKKVTAKKESAA